MADLGDQTASPPTTIVLSLVRASELAAFTGTSPDRLRSLVG